MDSVFIVVPRTLFIVYCDAQDTILCSLRCPGHILCLLQCQGYDSMFIVVPRTCSVFIAVPRTRFYVHCGAQDTILCLLWCPGHGFVFIVVPMTWFCLLLCPGHDFVFTVVPVTWFCLLLCPGHAGGVTGSVHSAGEEAEGGLWSPGEEVPQGQEAHQGVSTEVSVDAFSGLHWVFCLQVPSLSSGRVSARKTWSNSTTRLFSSEWQVLCLDIYSNFFWVTSTL